MNSLPSQFEIYNEKLGTLNLITGLLKKEIEVNIYDNHTPEINILSDYSFDKIKDLSEFFINELGQIKENMSDLNQILNELKNYKLKCLAQSTLQERPFSIAILLRIIKKKIIRFIYNQIKRGLITQGKEEKDELRKLLKLGLQKAKINYETLNMTIQNVFKIDFCKSKALNAYFEVQNHSFAEIFSSYLKSGQFKKDCLMVSQKFGENYFEKYIGITKQFSGNL